MSDYNPNSIDAMLARVLQRLDSQDAKLEAIHGDVKKTNGRVLSLESWRSELRGKTAVVAGAISVMGTIVAEWMWNRISK